MVMMMEQKLEALMHGFTTCLEDMVAEIEEVTGAEVIDNDYEYVIIAYEEDGEDVQVQIHLGGTKRTIVVTGYEEVYRG